MIRVSQLEFVQPVPAVLLRKGETERKLVNGVVGEGVCKFDVGTVSGVHGYLFGHLVPLAVFVLIDWFVAFAVQFGVAVDVLDSEGEGGVFCHAGE